MEAVAVYSDADVDAAHVRMADAAVRLGPAPAGESYLRADLIIAAAQATGCAAIHPGYGFLAERASFAAAVEAAGIVFVGPDHRAIAALGDKLAARRVATAAGVPVVPGTLEAAPVDRPDQVEAVVRSAEEVGYPLLVKARRAAAVAGCAGSRRRTSCRRRSSPGRARRPRRSATDRSTWSARSCPLATSRSSSSATRPAGSSPWASATARSSVATRSWSRRHPPRA